MIWLNDYYLMIRFISLLQAPTESIYLVVQKAKFVFLWYEENNNNKKKNKFNKNLNCRTVFFNECLEFCFMGIIKQELDQVKQIHNTHRIRTYPNQECPTGRPNLIYNVPENFGKFISCFEGFHRYFKNSITPNFIILHLSLFSLSFFIF